MGFLKAIWKSFSALSWFNLAFISIVLGLVAIFLKEPRWAGFIIIGLAGFFITLGLIKWRQRRSIYY